MFRIRELRKNCNITMKELGQAVGVSESAISQYETGKRQPDYETLLRIGEYFGVSVDYLLGNEGLPPHVDSDLVKYLEELKNRPEMRMLFKLSSTCTKEEVEQAVRIIEALRKHD